MTVKGGLTREKVGPNGEAQRSLLGLLYANSIRLLGSARPTRLAGFPSSPVLITGAAGHPASRQAHSNGKGATKPPLTTSN